jgi:hypothetical protein
MTDEELKKMVEYILEDPKTKKVVLKLQNNISTLSEDYEELTKKAQNVS